MATHLEDAQRPFQRTLPARVADSSSLAASNLASCLSRNAPTISSDEPFFKWCTHDAATRKKLLSPCCHQRDSPPCTDTIVQAGSDAALPRQRFAESLGVERVTLARDSTSVNAMLRARPGGPSSISGAVTSTDSALLARNSPQPARGGLTRRRAHGHNHPSSVTYPNRRTVTRPVRDVT